MISSATPELEGSKYVPLPLAAAREIVDKYQRLTLEEHPLFSDLGKQPVDLRALWLLVANVRAGISQNFVVWLATTIARVEDRRIGSLIAKQLDDELGRGDFRRIHSLLLDRFVAALEPWRIEGPDELLLSPGRGLLEDERRLFEASHPYEGVGALITGEIFANKMDHCLGEEIRRQDQLSDEALMWLTIHETLEQHHADDSTELALLVPSEGAALAATWRGADAQWAALTRFLDRVQQLRLTHLSVSRS
jgi:pyrroloquinoline quinone (PQQ) biosynthesis protein C